MNPVKFNLLFRKYNTDKEAFDQIYDYYYPLVVLHLIRRFGKNFAAQDTAQDLFLKLLANKPNIYIQCPSAWFYKLAEHMAIDELRKQKKTLPLNELLISNFDYEALIDDEEVKSKFETLDEVTQKIYYLHFWEGYSFKEISEELNLNYNTVRVKAGRGYKKMKEKLKHI